MAASVKSPREFFQEEPALRRGQTADASGGQKTRYVGVSKCGQRCLNVLPRLQMDETHGSITLHLAQTAAKFFLAASAIFSS